MKVSRRELALIGVWARAEAAQSSPSFRFFDAASAREIEAIASAIIPSGDSPGAREAGVIHFIDRALETFDRDQRPLYQRGLAQAQTLRRRLFPASRDLASLNSADLIRLMETLEKESAEFFEAVRVHTIMGFFADPSYGGNRDQVGWRHIGLTTGHHFTAPFGYYDAPEAE
ncbi:MAG: gluconate 2-dehydrogenase subunit 3 family protein [Bryobacteraceae bacterium]|nr:gluconate 2-dehydrogenase subunit 3 family protein [Bryobacteraceae bacterium]